jgi:hypothetical protein
MELSASTVPMLPVGMSSFEDTHCTLSPSLIVTVTVVAAAEQEEQEEEEEEEEGRSGAPGGCGNGPE